MDSPARHNSEKTDNNRLTDFSQGATLKNVPDATNTGNNLKQIEGGKSDIVEPPACCGFFMSAAQPSEFTSLPGVCGISRTSGNTHGAIFDALKATGQFYCCQNLKQIEEENAMQTAKNTDKGFTPVPCLTLPVSLLEVISQAKQDRAKTGKGNAYALLLEALHKDILPAFFIECQGNLSEVSRLLGIHRESVRKYTTLAGIDTSGAAVAGGAM